MKKVLALLLIFAFSLSLWGCGETEETGSIRRPSAETTAQTVPEETTEEVTEESLPETELAETEETTEE